MKKNLVPITPGEVLYEEFIKPFSLNQRQLAQAIGVPANRISQIIKGYREITVDTALRLGKFFGIEPEFWLNLQMRYNFKIAKNTILGEINRKVVTIKDYKSDNNIFDN